LARSGCKSSCINGVRVDDNLVPWKPSLDNEVEMIAGKDEKLPTPFRSANFCKPVPLVVLISKDILSVRDKREWNFGSLARRPDHLGYRRIREMRVDNRPRC